MLSRLVSNDTSASPADIGEGPGVVVSSRRNSRLGLRRTRKRRKPRNSRSSCGGGGELVVAWLSFSLLLGWAAVRSSALLELQGHPDSITNERTATFEYGCTALDVPQGDACGVEVRSARDETRAKLQSREVREFRAPGSTRVVFDTH